jgi:hypothetical protein
MRSLGNVVNGILCIVVNFYYLLDGVRIKKMCHVTEGSVGDWQGICAVPGSLWRVMPDGTLANVFPVLT